MKLLANAIGRSLRRLQDSTAVSVGQIYRLREEI